MAVSQRAVPGGKLRERERPSAGGKVQDRGRNDTNYRKFEILIPVPIKDHIS